MATAPRRLEHRAQGVIRCRAIRRLSARRHADFTSLAPVMLLTLELRCGVTLTFELHYRVILTFALRCGQVASAAEELLGSMPRMRSMPSRGTHSLPVRPALERQSTVLNVLPWILLCRLSASLCSTHCGCGCLHLQTVSLQERECSWYAKCARRGHLVREPGLDHHTLRVGSSDHAIA